MGNFFDIFKGSKKESAKADKKQQVNPDFDNIKQYKDISYGPYDSANLLDIYLEEAVTDKQPCIINVHGGAWMYGKKETYKPYCMSLAAKGFTVVNINYRLLPDYHFPAPLEDLNMAIKFIEAEGDKYCIDKDKLFIVGDSAGAQISSQYACIYSNSEYAKLFELVVPNVTIKAIALNCGLYDTRALACETPDDVFDAYLGIKRKKNMNMDDTLVAKLNMLDNITDSYPDTYLMSSYTDFLLSNYEPMYKYLESKKVRVTGKIYGDKKRKDLGHVFHVNIKLPESEEVNDDECKFFKECLL